MRGRAGRRSAPDEKAEALAFENLLDLQVQSASCLHELVKFQTALTSQSPDFGAYFENLREVLNSHGTLLASLDVIAVGLRFENPPASISAARETHSRWSEFEEGPFVCVELVGPEFLNQAEELQTHEIVFGNHGLPQVHSLVYLSKRKNTVEVHEYVHFGRRELGQAVELWLRGVEEHRRRALTIAALEEMSAIGGKATSRIVVDYFSIGPVGPQVVADHRDVFGQYLENVCVGWDLKAAEVYGLVGGVPTALARFGDNEHLMDRPPALDQSTDFPTYGPSEALDGSTDRDDSGRVRSSFRFDFREKVNWGVLTVSGTRLMGEDDRISLSQVARNIGSLCQTAFTVNQEVTSNLLDLKTQRPNEAAMLGALQQLQAEGSSGALVVLGVIDWMKYFESLDRLTLARLFTTTLDDLNDELSEHSGRFLSGILTGSILYAVCEGSFADQLTKDELEAKIRRALSRPKLTGSGSNVQPAFALGAVEMGVNAEISHVVGAAYSGLDKEIEARSNSLEWVVAESGIARGTRLARETELKLALQTDQMVSFFQPEYSLLDGSILSFESLVRWQHPERGLLGPNEFIPLAESAGLIAENDLQRLQHSAATAVSWGLAESGPEMRVNLSSSTLHIDGLAKRILDICDAEGLSPSQLVVEVTETAILRNLDVAIAQLSELRAADVGVALDDFGVGESSLARLRSLPLSIVKLDRQFVRPLPGDRSDRAFVEAVRTMIRAIDLDITAEGVETESQRDCLLEVGVDRAQGFLFSKPVPLAEAQLLLGTKVAPAIW